MPGILDLMNGIEAAGDRGRERGQQSRLASLYSQAVTAPQDQRQGLVAQMGSINPESAIAAQKGLSGMDESGAKSLARDAAYVVALAGMGDSPALQQAYDRLAANGRASGHPIPEGGYQPQYLPGLQKLATLADTQQGTPSELQTFDAMTKDFNPDELAKARRVATGIAARPSSAAISYELVKGDDGRTRLVATDPREVGTQVIGSGETYGSGVGGTTPVPAGGDLFASLPQGLQVTSGPRTPEHNAEVGGVANSYHLTNQARDIVPRSPQEADQVRQWAAQNGMEVINEGDHLHVEPRGNAPHANPFAGRTPEAEAAAVETAKGRAGLDLLPEQGRIEAENARIKKQAELDAQRQSDRIVDMPKARNALQGARNAATAVNRSIDQALPNINVWTSGMAGMSLAKLPGTQAANLRASIDTIEANLAFDRLQQMRQSSPTGGALGSVSERELTLLGSALASLKQSQSPKQLADNLRFVKQQYAKVIKQMEADFQTDYGSGQSQQVPSGARVIRYDAQGNRIQ
jgi:hypothetical protein